MFGLPDVLGGDADGQLPHQLLLSRAAFDERKLHTHADQFRHQRFLRLALDLLDQVTALGLLDDITHPLPNETRRLAHAPDCLIHADIGRHLG